MVTNVNEAISWVQSRLQFGIKPGLDRMEWLMERLGNPERRIRAIHIGGTNGKGSTLAFLRSILQTANYKVGAFTSPSLETFTDRITVNSEQISDADFVALINTIKPLVEQLDEIAELGEVTEFEVITTVAFLYFGKINPVDIAIFEVGLGGRHDSTNIINPLLSIITSVGIDHINILGPNLREIAHEKAGIIKNGVAVISGVQQEEAFIEIKQKAKKQKAALYQIGEQISLCDYEQLDTGEQFTLETPFAKMDNLQIAMFGKHQVVNASLAIMAAQFLKKYYALMIADRDIYQGIKIVKWPGRFEIVSSEPLIVLDGAHNEQAINSLTTTISERFANKRVKVLFSALRDKDLAVMIQKLDSIADEIIFVEFEHERAATADEMFKLSNSNGKKQHNDWRTGLKNELDGLAADEVLVITGSLYFISEVRECLNEVVK